MTRFEKYPNILKHSHSPYLSACEDGTYSVPKRRHVKFRRRGITRKKAYNTPVTYFMVHTVSLQVRNRYIVQEIFRLLE